MQQLHGVTTASALDASGITRRQLASRPEYTRVARGIYALPGARRDFWFRAAIAALAVGPPVALTSTSALVAYGLAARHDEVIQVVVPEGTGSRQRHASYRIRRSSHFPDIHEIAGVPVVPAAYALTDLARDTRDSEVSRQLSRCEGLRLANQADVAAVLEERGRVPGSARVRRVLADHGGEETHSTRERRLRAALRRLGVPIHPGQPLLRDAHGRPIRRMDIAIPTARIDVEVDGPHHLDPEQAERDRIDDRRAAAVGWLTLRYSVHEVDEELGRIAPEVRGHAARRAARPAA